MTGGIEEGNSAVFVLNLISANMLRDSADLTARAGWPAQKITGPLFETRARSEPGNGETVAFLPAGLRAHHRL